MESGIILAEGGRIWGSSWNNFWRKLKDYMWRKLKDFEEEVGRILGGSWKTRMLDINLLICLRHVAQFDFRCELWR